MPKTIHLLSEDCFLFIPGPSQQISLFWSQYQQNVKGKPLFLYPFYIGCRRWGEGLVGVSESETGAMMPALTFDTIYLTQDRYLLFLCLHFSKVDLPGLLRNKKENRQILPDIEHCSSEDGLWGISIT